MMKKYIVALAVACFATTCATPAFAKKQFNDQFKKIYAGDKANEDFVKLVKEAKCNVCHVKGEKKKVRNTYGKALHEAVEKAEFPVKEFKKDQEKYAEQLKEIFKKIEDSKSGDKEHETFKARMKANLLPGGDTDGKME
jgi:cytochrome c553